MFPIVLDLASLRVMLVGNGVATVRRLKLLDKAGAKHVAIFSDNPSDELLTLAGNRLIRKFPDDEYKNHDVVMVADLSEEISAEIYHKAKEVGKLVNVEDNKKYCDYHVPAIVRRGDLLLTVSTNGASPRLARKLRQMLEVFFGAEWSERIKEISDKRKNWKKEGLGIEDVARKTDEILDREGWLKEVYKNAKTKI